VNGPIVGDESWYDSRRTVAGWKRGFYINESPPLSALVVDRGRFRGYVTPTPALAAAISFKDALRRAGVVVAGRSTTGPTDPDAAVLADVESPPLATIIRFMDHESDNFTAEMLLKQLAALDDGRGTTGGGSRAVRDVLAQDGIPLNGVRIVDGSGLSRLDRLTARTLVALLRRAWNDVELGSAFYAALPVAGRSGTLSDRLRGTRAAGRVVAKTGTTAVASALSGFVGRRYAFAILQNGSPISTWWARRAQDRFVSVLAAQ
jgi:D-alanyl-D-alanine carboxypeptidase/D-alanyl-D-alanine-endopeptidase (penicillin-binding protein 4)